VSTTIQKWGNSQGLRVPKNILEKAHITVGDNVEVKFSHGAIVVKPVNQVRGKYNLRDLVSKIPDNFHQKEVSWGKAIGKEVW
jgi:antitoxin MazE